MYQYYIQQIVNKYNASVIGYELLLRKQLNAQLVPITDFSEVPAKIVAGKIVAVAQLLSTKVPFLSVNLNRAQLSDPAISEELCKIQKLLRPVQIQVELTEDQPQQPISDAMLKQQFHVFLTAGMTISIDDVDCICNTEQQVRALLPFISEIKFALQNLGKSVYLPEVQQRILFWRNFARQYKLRFILEGIENEAIDHFIDTFHIDNRQGYFYEKPHPISEISS
ncbi:EAL domain-containing protein [Pediococcus siamensis]|uniref:EAL domain-containing protein n=1 Tax=Pediococcus siamensis TaxID=381829 RepID=UPI0039A212F1